LEKQNVATLDEDNLKKEISHSSDLSGLTEMTNYINPQGAHRVNRPKASEES
jgi:hypothetical protein